MATIFSSSDEEDGSESTLTNGLGISLNLPSVSASLMGKNQQRLLKVVSVFPRSEASFKALLDVVSVSKAIGAHLDQISFQRLDFGEIDALDQFYSCDVAIVDATLLKERPTLFYHLGIRESFGMKDNIVMVHDEDSSKTSSVQISSACYNFIAYTLSKQGRCFVTRDGHKSDSDMTLCKPLVMKLRRLLTSSEGSKRTMCKENFLRDLRNIREKLSGTRLKNELNKMKILLGDPSMFTADIIINLLLSYRDIQDYSSMVELIEELPPNHKETKNIAIQQHYAFALNRRNSPGDRGKAIKVVLALLENKVNYAPDTLGLCGRIYKDMFMDSDYEDTESRDQAIEWYRRAFQLQQTQYAGINLATLLVVSGQNFTSSEELQRVCMILNGIIGRKGSLVSLKVFWDVGVFCGISILAQNYDKACQAAECLFKLKPPSWYLKSLLRDVTMIEKFCPRGNSIESSVNELFDFWMDFLVEASKDSCSDTRFPILILEVGDVYVPSYVVINEDSEEEALRIWNIGTPKNTKKIHNWVFSPNSIKGLSLYKRDCRSLFLYVTENSDDFQLFFSTEHHRLRFHNVVMRTSKKCSCLTRMETEAVDDDDIQYEYDLDDKRERVVLGRGTFGVVYAARELITQVKIAVKEVPERDQTHVQPLHEEITLHRQFSHKNIVQYLGSRSEDGIFKIFMEQVPGGSLSSLIQSKWGPLLHNEQTVAFYTKQILEGAKYLHAQKVVHRDIKGDNVLVNTYSGVCKLSDFGTSKRLAGINPNTKTFAGTMQFMAPEVIDHGQRGYGPPADIWSIGCTVVEMMTGKPPFYELEPVAAIFKVGMFKTHPDIPESLSEQANDFLLRTFVPDPLKRATAEELLGHAFLAKKEKRKKAENMKLLIPKPESSESNGPLLYDGAKTAGLYGSDPQSPDDFFSQSPPASDPPKSPSDHFYNAIDQDSRTKRGLSRSLTLPTRTSNESLSSTGSSSTTSSLEQPNSKMSSKDIFFEIKQEHERTSLVIEIMEQKNEQMCSIWMSKLEKMSNVSLLNMNDLKSLLNCVRDHIVDKTVSIRSYLSEIEKQHGVDWKILHEIQLSLHLFPEAASEVISKHRKVLPHWMFGVDKLVRNAVTVTLQNLTTEMRGRLQFSTSMDESEAESSLPLNGDIEKSEVKKAPTREVKTSEHNELVEKINKLSQENTELMKKLVSTQETLKHVLANSIENHNSVIDTYRHKSTLPKSKPGSDVVYEMDEKLADWLVSIGIQSSEIDKFAKHFCSFDAVINNFDLEDLKDIGLKVGTRKRIWKKLTGGHN
eukprot:gene98-705_t